MTTKEITTKNFQAKIHISKNPRQNEVKIESFFNNDKVIDKQLLFLTIEETKMLAQALREFLKND